ncbi:MAG: PorV/PorQ family protein [Elusimicrobia bacterium]|nr:PorV/PorQ family protein [Elusimicrobiota bacterium]
MAHIFAFLAVTLLSSSIYASGPGTGSADFLKIPVGARETSLGGAFTAVADNANAVYYNPAGLSLLQNPEISFTNNKYLEGLSQQWLAAAYPYKSGAFGLGVNYLSVPAFGAYDNLNNPAGSVSAYDAAAYLSWGGRLPVDYKFIRSVSYGASLKYISEKLDTEHASGYGLDLGLLAATSVKNLRFGFGVDNLVSSKIKFIDEGAGLPLKFKAGVSYRLAPDSPVAAILFSADYNFPKDGAGYVAAGIEGLLYRAFAVRLGYSSFGDISNGLNFGLGFDLSRYTGRSISVDYSFAAASVFGDIQKLGITCKFRPRQISGAAAARSTVPARAEAPMRPPRETHAPAPAAGGGAVSRYADILKTGSLYQKRNALAELGEQEGEAPFNLLLSVLKNDDPVLVLDAVSVLSGLDDLRVIDPFIELLKAENADIQLAAISRLARYKDERVLQALEGCLGDKSPEVRSRAAVILGDFGDARAVESLKAALKKEEASEVKNALISSLKELDPGFQGTNNSNPVISPPVNGLSQ